MNAIRERATEHQLASAERLARHELALKVHRATGDGDLLIDSLVDFVNGDIPGARACHIHSANVELAVMGGYLPQDYPGAASRIHPAAADGERKPRKPKVTTKQLLNKPVGEYIRDDTDDGAILIDFLAQMVDPPPNPNIFSKEEVLPSDRLAAAKELLRRGYGSRNPRCYYGSSAFEEQELNSIPARLCRERMNGFELATFLLEVVRNQRVDLHGQPIKKTFTFSERIWSAKYLLYMAFDIPWEHVTHEATDEYLRQLEEQERGDLLRRAKRYTGRNAITPEQEAEVLAMFAEMQRAEEEADAQAAQRSAANKTDAASNPAVAQADASDSADKSADTDASAAGAAAKDNGESAAQDTGADTDDSADENNDKNAAADASDSADADNKDTAADTNAPDRGATAVANALARHPEVDLDTALENHHATAGIPKENLTHEQIYDAITAEANFQKRQAIIQSRMRAATPDEVPEDNDPPKTRSP